MHYGLNYGGVLQTYATKETLKKLGFEPIIIDRIPEAFGRNYPLHRKLAHPFTQRAFYLFRKHELQPISRPVFNSQELTDLLQSDYYGIVIGSDQVWRKEVFSVDGDYYMIHQQQLPIKKVAYAASTGVATWEYDEQETREIAAALKTFTGISVREEESVHMMREHCGVEACSILDPTLLADPQIYEPLRKKAKLSGTRKLITYILDWTVDKQRIIEQACVETGLEVQHILPQEKKRKGIWSRIINQDPCVYDWVNQIATADFVVTDSFHGMAFCIIFNKQFVAIGNATRGMVRFTSLLGQFGLSQHLTVDTLPNITQTIDYHSVNKVLTDKRIEGINFLRNSL
ncbi:polysaccharide pyruvyl transferase family protein [Bacteroides sp. AN502(2024)]